MYKACQRGRTDLHFLMFSLFLCFSGSWNFLNGVLSSMFWFLLFTYSFKFSFVIPYPQTLIFHLFSCTYACVTVFCWFGKRQVLWYVFIEWSGRQHWLGYQKKKLSDKCWQMDVEILKAGVPIIVTHYFKLFLKKKISLILLVHNQAN